MSESFWSYFACLDCLFGIVAIAYYCLQLLFGELSEEEVGALGETIFEFLTVKVIWTFFCLDVDIWEVIIWTTWLFLNCFLLSLSTILLSRAMLAANDMHR